MLGYISLVWVIILLFARFDHYGKVCSGDYNGLVGGADPEIDFPLLFIATTFSKYYLISITILAGFLFLVSIIYSCCTPR